MQRTGCAVLMVCVLAIAAGHAAAADHYLTIGGGYSPAGNQVSLERNVYYFRSVLERLSLAGAPHEVLFSDGNAPTPDLQFVDPAAPVPKANLLVARLFDQENGIDLSYRNCSLPAVWSASTLENIDRWFQEVGSKLVAGDRLVVYLTGHGGKGEDASNTHFLLWGGGQVSVKDFVTRLDKVSPDVQVVLVMVQCYSGGFANVIFDKGDPKQPLSKAHRCGFFATVADRQAAGCTADVREENYQEYSSYFWAGLSGRSRVNQPVTPPDYNGDGHTSFAEAHAFSILSADTIDIPVKTSDALLRTLSKTKADGMAGLVTPDAPYEQLATAASPIDKAVLDGLSFQLQLTRTDRSQAARDLANEIENQRKNLRGKHHEKENEYRKLRGEMAEQLKLQWPELASAWHPHTVQLLQSQSPQLVAFIESHKNYSRFVQLHDEMAQIDVDQLNLERRWVKCQRLLRELESVALAANLSRVATPEIQQQYTALLAAEGQLLSPNPPPPQAQAAGMALTPAGEIVKSALTAVAPAICQ